ELERRVLVENSLLEVAQCGARLDPQLLDERATRVLVRGERLALPPTAVEGQHELAAQPLAQRMVGDEALQLADNTGLSCGCETWTCSAFCAVSGGVSSHDASIKWSRETTRFGSRRRTARSVRCFCPPTSIDRPSSISSNGPRMPNSIVLSATLAPASRPLKT